MKKASWFIFLAILAMSCLDDPDCYLLNNNFVGVTFRVIGSGKAWTIPPTTIKSLDPENIFPPDAIQLNYLKNGTEYVFETKGGGTRYLDLGYIVQSQFVSEDCGTRYILSALQILEQSGFDSVRIVNETPGNQSGAKNIEIFRCPEADTVGISFRQLGFTGLTRTSTEVSVTADVIVGYSGGKDTISGANAVFLPVDLDKDSTTYTFIFEDGYSPSARNLTLKYLVSRDSRYRACAERDQFFVDSLSIGSPEDRFDSVSVALDADGIALRSLDDPAINNVNVYRCPETNLMTVAFINSRGGATPVSIESISSDYADTVYTFDADVSTVTLPLNTEADASIFYIKYAEGQDTLSLGYSRMDRTVYKQCGTQKIYYDLATIRNQANIEVVESDTLQYPPITHIEIIPD